MKKGGGSAMWKGRGGGLCVRRDEINVFCVNGIKMKKNLITRLLETNHFISNIVSGGISYGKGGKTVSHLNGLPGEELDVVPEEL